MLVKELREIIEERLSLLVGKNKSVFNIITSFTDEELELLQSKGLYPLSDGFHLFGENGLVCNGVIGFDFTKDGCAAVFYLCENENETVDEYLDRLAKCNLEFTLVKKHEKERGNKLIERFIKMG